MHTVDLPPTKYWDRLEVIAWELLDRIWDEAQRNGVSGQPQQGVDIFGRFREQWVGAQVKKRKPGDLMTESELAMEVEKAKEFTPHLANYVIITSAQRTAMLQQAARQMTDNNKKRGQFSVQVWAWEDLMERLCPHKDILHRHFSELNLTDDSVRSAKNTQTESAGSPLELQRQHDVELFRNIEAILSEEKLQGFLENLGANAFYYHVQFIGVFDCYKCLSLASNVFVDHLVAHRAKGLSNSLQKLLDHCGLNFFDYPPGQQFGDMLRVALQPTLRHGEGRTQEFDPFTQWRESRRKLDSLVKEVQENYREFRLEVKNRLYV